MALPHPLPSAQAILPDVQVRAAGIFGVQDKAAASGLVGAHGVVAAAYSLVPPAAVPVAELEQARQWIPVSVLVAVSGGWVHICSWDVPAASRTELTRLERASTSFAVERFRNARRLTLTDARSGYRLALTATVSRLSPFGSGARAVLAELGPPRALGMPPTA